MKLQNERSAERAPAATLIFALACLAAFVVVLTLVLVQSYQESINRAETRARAYSQVVSANAALLMAGTYQALRRIDSAVGDQLTKLEGDSIGDLNRAVESLPSDVRAWLIDAEGTPRLSNTGLSKAFSVADRDYFIGLRNGDEFRVSPLMLSRTKGDAVFAIAKRIERGGQFVGAAVIIIPATFLEQLRTSLELGAKSTVSLIRSDGQIVTRSPIPAVSEPTDLSKYVLFTTYLPKSAEGTYSAISPTDGVERIVSYRRVPDFPLVAIASVALEEALSSFWQTVWLLSVFAIPGLIGLSTFAIWTVQSQRALASALAQNQLLFREIHHRVKNNLQQAMSLINVHDIPLDVREEISRRLKAMAAVHEHMYRADRYTSVLASAFMAELIAVVRGSFSKDVKVTVDVAPPCWTARRHWRSP